MKASACLLLVLCAPTGHARQAGTATNAAILRLETGGHTGAVTGLFFVEDADQKGQFSLLSTSKDHSVRQWRFRAEDLLGSASLTSDETFRYHSDAIGRGEIWCSAYDPISHLAAMGRRSDPTKAEGEDKTDILITSPEKPGNPVQTVLHGCFGVVYALTFRPDGKELAALDATGHIYVYDTTNWRLLRTFTIKPKDEENPQCLAFSPNGNELLVGGNEDTLLLLNSSTGKKLKDFPLPKLPNGGHIDCLVWKNDVMAAGDSTGHVIVWHNGELDKQQPVVESRAVLSLALDSKSEQLAIGLNGTKELTGEVKVWSRTLRDYIGSSLKAHGPICAVTFAPAGSYIVAGDQSGEILTWELSGRGAKAPATFAGTGHPVFNVIWSKDSRFVAWSEQHENKSPTKAFNVSDMAQALVPEDNNLEENAGHVHVKVDEVDKDKPLVLYGENDKSTLIESGTRYKQVGPKDTITGNMEFDAYTYSQRTDKVFAAIKLDNVIQEYDPQKKANKYETGKNPNRLRRFGGYSGTILSLAVSPDGNYLAAGSSDQIVRIWKLDAPTPTNDAPILPLLCVFVSGNDDEYVAWNEQTGYHATSVKGDEFITWQINRAPDKPATIALTASIQKGFNSPAKLGNLYKTGLLPTGGDQNLSTKIANLPFIAGVDDIVGAQRFAKRFIVKQGKLPKSAFKFVMEKDEPGTTYNFQNLTSAGRVVRVNNGSAKVPGSSLPTDGAAGKDNDSVPLLPNAENILSITATNSRGDESSPIKVRVKYEPADGEGKTAKGDLHLLSIGISKFKNKAVTTLDYCANDANEFKNVFEKRAMGLYDNVFTKPLTETDATHDKIKTALEDLSNDGSKDYVKPDDTLILFLAGHGSDPQDARDAAGNPIYYFTPQDFDPERPKETGLDWNQILAYLEKVKARKIILFVDHCFSGGVNKLINSHSVEKAVKDLRNSHIYCFAASTANEESYEYSAGKHGAFTYKLLEILDGRGGITHGKITLEDVRHYVNKQVPELMKDRGPQHPRDYFPLDATTDIPLVTLP